MKKLNALSKDEMKKVTGGIIKPVCTDEYIDQCVIEGLVGVTTDDQNEYNAVHNVLIDMCYSTCINPL